MKESVIILIHTDYPWPEGLSYRTHNMAKSISRRYRVIVVAPILESSYPSGFQEGRIYDIYRLKLTRFMKIRGNRLLYRMIFVLAFTFLTIRARKYFDFTKIKVIQAEQQLALLPSILVGYMLNVPVILDDALAFDRLYEGISPYFKFFLYVFESLLLRRCRLIICGCNNVAESFCRHYNLPRYKVLVVPNGANMVDNPKYLQECSKDILFVASMYSKQNRRAVHNLVKIFSEVVKEVTEARLIIIGGPLFLLREVIMDLAEEKRLYTKNTLMLGQVSETVKKRCLKKACICPLPYDPADGLAGGTRLKALECLAYGKIVVSTSAGIEGIDGVINGENMIIVNRLEEFKKYIIEVLNHPEKYTQMRKKALRLATKYSWDNVLPRYKDIIDSI